MNRIGTVVALLLFVSSLGCLRIVAKEAGIQESPLSREPTKQQAFLWEVYPKCKISPANPAQLRHADLMACLETVVRDHPDTVRLRPLGESVQGRSINLLTVGTGPKKLLLWSQMHGDEPTATAALLDILEFMTENPSMPFVRTILDGCTLLIIPMLNPDGAERYDRRNAMDIDINRDARYLQTPEGRILKAAQEEFRPQFGFNLHDHGPRKMVGRTKRVVAISLLVPPFDYEETPNATTRKATKVAATLRQAIRPWCEGMVSRYDADYMPRAFGDSMQSWGVSTILLESGGWTGSERTVLVRINFVGLLSVFHAIATGSYLSTDAQYYDELVRSGEHDLFDLVITQVTVVNGLAQPPFLADIGVNYRVGGRSSDWSIRSGRIADLGDLRVTAGKQTLDGEGLVCVPGFISFQPEVSPSRLPDATRRRELLRSGVTTVVGRVDLSDRKELDRLSRMRDSLVPFVGSVEAFPEAFSQEEREQFLYGISRNIQAVYPEVKDATARQYLSWFHVREATPEALAVPERMLWKDVSRYTSEMAKALRLDGRGVIRQGAPADLLLFRKDSAFESEGMLQLRNLECVLRDGQVVYENAE